MTIEELMGEISKIRGGLKANQIHTIAPTGVNYCDKCQGVEFPDTPEKILRLLKHLYESHSLFGGCPWCGG